MQRSKFNFQFHVKDKATASASAIRAKAMTSVSSIFSTVLGNKKSLPSKVKKTADSDFGNGKDQWNIAAWASPKPEPVKVSLSQLLTLDETMEPNRADKLGKQNRKIQRGKVNIIVPLLRFLDYKKKGWDNFVRTVKIGKKDLYDVGDGVVTKVRRKVKSWRFIRVNHSKLVVIRFKLKMLKSVMKKKVTKQGDHEDNDDRELCKKRILMGGRCKPLCSSGVLSYDTNGFLLPEIY